MVLVPAVLDVVDRDAVPAAPWKRPCVAGRYAIGGAAKVPLHGREVGGDRRDGGGQRSKLYDVNVFRGAQRLNDLLGVGSRIKDDLDPEVGIRYGFTCIVFPFGTQFGQPFLG